jgi:hypothetical protein
MLTSVLKKSAVAFAIAAAVGSAGAMSVDFGTLSTSVGVSDVHVVGSFNDTFSFTMGTGTGALGSLVGLDLLGDLTMQYRFGVGATPVWSSFSSSFAVPSDPNTGAYALYQTFAGLTAGTKYWINLKGTATDAYYSATLAPVPEPETYAMLLAGLGLIGTIARRRKTAITAKGV